MEGCTFTGIHNVDVTGSPIDGPTVSEGGLRQSVFRVLEANVLCSMATVTPDGHAHINTAYFSYSDKLELYFWSHPDSLHCRNLQGNPSMAMTVFSSVQQWTNPGLGLQLFGPCEQASGSSANEAERSYRTRFPPYDKWREILKEDDPASRYRYYRFAVTAVKVLDEKDVGDAVWVLASVVRQ